MITGPLERKEIARILSLTPSTVRIKVVLTPPSPLDYREKCFCIMV